MMHRKEAGKPSVTQRIIFYCPSKTLSRYARALHSKAVY